ncbi:MAG: tyrosine-type recombinase/integrase [Candidatus Micrarchaeia archaeon]
MCSKSPNQSISSKPQNIKGGFDYDTFLNLVKAQSTQLSFHQLKELKGAINHVFAKKYRGSAPPKYGTINKGFTELELQSFLRSVKSDKFRLLFKYQAYLGLRIGEVCKLHVSNIDFDKRELTIKSEKSGKMHTLLIPFDLFKCTVEYIAKNEAAIKSSNDGEYRSTKYGKIKVWTKYMLQ